MRHTPPPPPISTNHCWWKWELLELLYVGTSLEVVSECRAPPTRRKIAGCCSAARFLPPPFVPGKLVQRCWYVCQVVLSYSVKTSYHCQAQGLPRMICLYWTFWFVQELLLELNQELPLNFDHVASFMVNKRAGRQIFVCVRTRGLKKILACKCLPCLE